MRLSSVRCSEIEAFLFFRFCCLGSGRGQIDYVIGCRALSTFAFSEEFLLRPPALVEEHGTCGVEVLGSQVGFRFGSHLRRLKDGVGQPLCFWVP